MIKAIIFDCFGVIRVDAFELAYRHFGGDPVEDVEFLRKAVYESNSGGEPSYISMARRLGIEPTEWRTFTVSQSAIDQDVLDYVKQLRKTHKTAMLSNVGKGRINEYFEPGFLAGYFDAVVASGDIGFAKPEPSAYEYVADELGVRFDECVFTDDRQEYVNGAIAVGMQAILFTSAAQFKKDLEALLKK